MRWAGFADASDRQDRSYTICYFSTFHVTKVSNNVFAKAFGHCRDNLPLDTSSYTMSTVSSQAREVKRDEMRHVQEPTWPESLCLAISDAVRALRRSQHGRYSAERPKGAH